MTSKISPSLVPSTSPSPSGSAVGPQLAMTTAGYVIPTVTGILSTISSLIILNIIRASPQKLFTTYHRIMALMCVFDIMASVCMALTTLPMPSDDVLRFAGHMIGNTVTCQVQGYIIMFGLIGGGSLYMCLSWYFVLKISLKWDLDTIKTKMEPLFYFVSIFMAIFLPSYCLSKNMIHSVKDNSFCRIAPDHSSCNYSNDKIFFDCEQELFDEYDYVQNIFINYR